MGAVWGVHVTREGRRTAERNTGTVAWIGDGVGVAESGERGGRASLRLVHARAHETSKHRRQHSILSFFLVLTPLRDRNEQYEI